MSSTENDSEDNNKEPLFIPRNNGTAWDLNLRNRRSYSVLAAILAFPYNDSFYNLSDEIVVGLKQHSQ